MVTREQHWLPRSILALEVGDWLAALDLCRRDTTAEDPLEVARIAVVLRTAAGALRAQAAGDVASARRQLFDAAAMLPSGLTRPNIHGGRLANPIQIPFGDSHSTLASSTWRLARIVWREQTLIADLMRQLVKYSSPRDHLVEAYIQFMFEIEFSPFSWYRPKSGNGRHDHQVTPTRCDLCRRASNLRKLALPRTGDVSKSVWLDIGGHRGLRAAAQLRLANRLLTPRAMESAEMPVRLGRRRAWEHARLWIQDLGY